MKHVKKECVAMLLAGGQGSRLYALTKDMAKPAVPYGGKYRIIDFPLSNCVNSGIDTVGVLTQYQPLVLNEYIGNGHPWGLDRVHGGVHVLPPYESSSGKSWYEGTANAIYQNISFIDRSNPDYVAVLSGDHIYKMNYNKMLEFHKAHNADATIAVLEVPWEEAPRFGIYPLEETVEAMMKLKEQGKIRAIGASNVTADIIRGYCKYGQLDVIQEKYSLLTRRVEKQLLPTCKELGVSVQAYSPLEQGLLTGKVTMETTYPEGSTRNSNPSFQPARRAQALDMLAKWSDLTEKYDCSLAQLVIALTARMIPGLHVLCGARTPQQVMDNAGALNIKLDGADAVRMKWDVDAIS